MEKPIGVVHVKDVFSVLRTPVPPPNARALARPVLFAPETQTITTLLSDFRRRRQHMAIVVDEWGAVAGVVTLEDLLEELVGEIADEHEDSIDPVIPLAEGAFTVAGRVRVSEIAQLFDARSRRRATTTRSPASSRRASGTSRGPARRWRTAGCGSSWRTRTASASTA